MHGVAMVTLFLVSCSGEEASKYSEPTDPTIEQARSEDSGDTDTDSDTDTDPDWHLVLTTTDYTTGALARIDPDGAVSDGLLPVSSDAAVTHQDGKVYVLNRSSENTVQVFDSGDYSMPALEFSTGDGSNPHDVAACGGKLFVSLYSQDHLGVYDAASGLATGTVDLSAFDDGDGSPEADGMMVSSNGHLYVALNQLDYIKTYASADGSGTLVKVDCSTNTVVGSWHVGPNPRLQVHPDQPDQALLTGGDYYLPDYSGPKLDGGIWVFDTTTDTLAGPFLSEADVGYNLGGIAGDGQGHAITTFDDGYSWSVVCLSFFDWSYSVIEGDNWFAGGMAADPDGGVWVSLNQGFTYGGGTVTPGVGRYDPVNCVRSGSATTALPPSAITAVP